MRLRVEFLDVGQGDSALPPRRTDYILIDGVAPTFRRQTMTVKMDPELERDTRSIVSVVPVLLSRVWIGSISDRDPCRADHIDVSTTSRANFKSAPPSCRAPSNYSLSKVCADVDNALFPWNCWPGDVIQWKRCDRRRVAATLRPGTRPRETRFTCAAVRFGENHSCLLLLEKERIPLVKAD